MNAVVGPAAVIARAHPEGNRIDLTWDYPTGGGPDAQPDVGMLVVRRARTYPATVTDGQIVGDAVGLRLVRDTGLHAGTEYFYALFSYHGDRAHLAPEPPVLAHATATGRHGTADLMYALLPSLYRRYDADGGPLRRFLELPGGQLDQLLSLAATAGSLHDPERLDSALLPLLADWIGWRTDRAASVGSLRTRIAQAPNLYRMTGSAAAVDAAVALATGWPSRTKEFVHNVACTNRPEQLTLWAVRRPPGGSWPGTPAAELVSVHVVHDGRPACVPDTAGAPELFLHARRGARWQLWSKASASPGAAVADPSEAGRWAASVPLPTGPGQHRVPTAARLGGAVWAFWETHPTDPSTDPGIGPPCRMSFAVRDDHGWSDPAVFDDPGTERRGPAAVSDPHGGLWLFWREPSGDGRAWSVRFNRHDGTGWQLDPPGTVPEPVTGPPTEADLFAAIDLAHPGGSLWLLWAGRVPAGPSGGKRWQVAMRVKASLDPAAADWADPVAVPKPAAQGHDREPVPLFTADGAELLWSSTGGGGWAVLAASLDPATGTTGAPTIVSPDPHTQRAPLPVALPDGGTLLLLRSNRAIVRAAGVVGDPDKARLLDPRFSGTTTVRSADTAKRALAGQFEDFQTYTYTGGPPGDGPTSRYTQHTIGVFLDPPGDSGGGGVSGADGERALALQRVTDALNDFLPLTTRAVLDTT